MSETDIGRAIRKALESLGYIVTRVHSGKVKVRGGWMQLADEGTPDHVVSCPDGRTVWLETKTEEGDLSEAQKEWHARARRMGHAVAVVRSPREALEAVRSQESAESVLTMDRASANEWCRALGWNHRTTLGLQNAASVFSRISSGTRRELIRMLNWLEERGDRTAPCHAEEGERQLDTRQETP